MTQHKACIKTLLIFIFSVNFVISSVPVKNFSSCSVKECQLACDELDGCICSIYDKKNLQCELYEDEVMNKTLMDYHHAKCILEGLATDEKSSASCPLGWSAVSCDCLPSSVCAGSEFFVNSRLSGCSVHCSEHCRTHRTAVKPVLECERGSEEYMYVSVMSRGRPVLTCPNGASLIHCTISNNWFSDYPVPPSAVFDRYSCSTDSGCDVGLGCRLTAVCLTL